jgi:hypothetical protein
MLAQLVEGLRTEGEGEGGGPPIIEGGDCQVTTILPFTSHSC